MLWSRSKSQFEIQTQEFTFRQWSVVLKRKAFRRNITIALRPGEPIQVRAGLKTPMQKIEQFLAQKEGWIDKHYKKFTENAAKFPQKKLLPQETFPFLGESLSLKIVPTPLKQAFFSRQNVHLQLHLPEASLQHQSQEQLQRHFPLLQKFYQREAEKLICERIKIWSVQMNLFPRELKFRNQKTRWGSCSSKGSIQINWRLMGAPLEVIDYILIHELAHLRHMNHSEFFWQLVETHCPDYRISEKWLKDNHAALDFLSQ
jgi:hypothetical protein